VVALETLINILEIKVGRHVQKARSDRGKEFKNVGVQQLFAALGIEQHLRVGYAPQYNGAAKCAIGVVYTMSRALHKEAGLPAQWGGGLNATCCVDPESASGNRSMLEHTL
jgi:transposase InsO family protein